MKNIFDAAEKKEDIRTTNYPKDSHKDFCKRCYAHNKGCINTKTYRKDPKCSI